MINNKKTLALTIISSLLLVACGGGGGSDAPSNPGTPSTNPTGTPVPPVPPVVPTVPPPASGAPIAISPDAAATFTYEAKDGFNGDSAKGSIVTVGDAVVQKIEFGQINLKQADSPYFALAAERDALIRVTVTGTVANLKAPNLKVSITRASDNSVVFSQVVEARDAQRVLPVVADKADIYYAAFNGRDFVDNGSNAGVWTDRTQASTEIKSTDLPDLNRSYLIRWPAAQVVAEKLIVKAEIVDGAIVDNNRANNIKQAELEPRISKPLNIKLVPIQVGGLLPTMLSDDEIRKIAMKYFPLSTVNISHRTPWVAPESLLGAGMTVDAAGGQAALSKLLGYPKAAGQAANNVFAQLVDQDGAITPTMREYRPGFFTQDGSVFSSWYLGIVNAKNVGGLTMDAFGTIIGDNHYSIYKALSNELGNGPGYSEDVGVCGSIVSLDKNYPYPAGGLNSVWGIDLVSNKEKITLFNPSKHYTSAGYCEPIWSADYQVKKWLRDFKVGDLTSAEWNKKVTKVDPYLW